MGLFVNNLASTLVSSTIGSTLRFITLRFRTLKFLFASAVMLLSFGNNALATDHSPIKIGISVSLTGEYKAQGENLLQGLSMWSHDVNARGALLGRHVEIIHYDDQSNPEKSAEIYEKLITQDEIDLLIGPYASNLTLKASEVAEKYNFPMVSGTSAATAIWSRGYKNIFQVDVPAKEYMADGVRLAEEGGFRSVGILYQEGTFTSEVAQGAKETAEKAGLEVVTYKSYPAGTTDFVELVRQLKINKADLILGATYLSDSIAIVKELKRQDYSPRAVGFTSGPSVVEFGEQLGDLAEGIIGFTPWIRATREPMAQDFDYRYRSIYGRGADSNSAGGYAAGEVLEAAVRLANSLDKDKLREQLSTMSFLSIMGRYKVDEQGLQKGKDMYIIQWRNGTRRLVLPEKYAEMKSVRFTPWNER